MKGEKRHADHDRRENPGVDDRAHCAGKTAAPIEVKGCVHNVRRMANFAFVILRRREGTMQCVAGADIDPAALAEGNYVAVTGEPAFDARAPHGFELRLTGARVLSRPLEGWSCPSTSTSWT